MPKTSTDLADWMLEVLGPEGPESPTTRLVLVAVAVGYRFKKPVSIADIQRISQYGKTACQDHINIAERLGFVDSITEFDDVINARRFYIPTMPKKLTVTRSIRRNSINRAL